MSWLGAGIGAVLGSMRGGVLASIIGAVIGSYLEDKVRGTAKEKEKLKATGTSSRTARRRASQSNELAVLAAIAAMLAKMAKADGRVSEAEVLCCEGVFTRLGLSAEKRRYCVDVFQRAKGDEHSIYDYARSFAEVNEDRNLREIVYDILWDVACADGRLSSSEREMLARLPPFLRISEELYSWQCRTRRVRDDSQRGTKRPDPPNPYTVLGVSPNASDDEVRQAYREKAKHLHPDILRAQGLSEELIGKANEQMARVNAAWAEIRKSRGL